MKRVIMLSDCQSFYASVEKAAHPEYKDHPLVVAGDPERRSGIVLAACPIAKKHGITTAETLGSALARCPDLVVMRPQMQHYIDVSLRITKIYEEFTDLVEVFSIDEQFLDVTGSLHLFGDPITIAKSIQQKVLRQTGVRVRIGISSNKILAKIATDIWAKKNESGIFTLQQTELETLLWPQPVNKMFGVGSRMTAHFSRLGMNTIGDIAKTPLPRLKEKFRLRFGKQSDIQAEVMWRTANGLDDSPVTSGTFNANPKSVGHMMTLPRDYRTIDEIKVPLRELTELVCQRARAQHCMGSVVSVSCRGSSFDCPTGFSRQRKMVDPTYTAAEVYQTAIELFRQHWDGLPIRSIGVSLGKLVSDRVEQLKMFDPFKRQLAVERMTDIIKEKHGDTSIIKASSLTRAGQALNRAGKIGGHYK